MPVEKTNCESLLRYPSASAVVMLRRGLATGTADRSEDIFDTALQVVPTVAGTISAESRTKRVPALLPLLGFWLFLSHEDKGKLQTAERVTGINPVILKVNWN